MLEDEANERKAEGKSESHVIRVLKSVHRGSDEGLANLVRDRVFRPRCLGTQKKAAHHTASAKQGIFPRNSVG